MKKSLLAAALLLAGVCTPALASAHEWTGFYAGVNGGYGGDKFAYPVNGSFTSGGSTLDLTGKAQLDSSGFLGGGQIGYGFSSPEDWLFAVEADIDASAIKGELGASGSLSGVIGGAAALKAGSRIDYLGTVRAKIGHAIADDLVLYGTGGFAYGGVKSSYAIDVTSGGATVFSTTNAKRVTDSGWTAGAGVSYPIGDKMSLSTEYLYVDLGKHTLIDVPFAILGGSGNIRVQAKTTANVLRMAMNWNL
jgi:outer membrane immunogenic protein